MGLIARTRQAGNFIVSSSWPPLIMRRRALWTRVEEHARLCVPAARILVLAGLGLVMLGATLPPVLAQSEPTALEILRRSEDLMRGTTQAGSYSLLIQRPDWERVIEFDFWGEGQERAFILVKAPVKERGVAFLKIRREMWQYIPRINRVIKIPPSMMMQSWMGSGFTNDDLVRESSIVEDYEHTLEATEELEQGAAYRISLRPRPEAPIAWDRLLYWIRAEDFVPLRAEFFNERGERVRTIRYEDIRNLGGRTIPSRLELVEDRWPDRKTVMQLDDLVFDRPISPSIFTQSNLRRAR